MPRKDKAPKKDWLGPPNAIGLKPLAVATKTNLKGEWIWKEVPQTAKDKKLRKEFNRRMEKADAKGRTFIKWPPTDA